MIGAPALAGVLVTPQTALTFAAVFSAVNAISSDIAAFPVGVHERTGPESSVPVQYHNLNGLLGVAPNEEGNAHRYKQATIGHTLLWGNGYSEIVHNGRGDVQAIYPLNPAAVQLKRNEAKKLSYHLTDVDKSLPPSKVAHIAGLGFDGLVGYSVIHYGRQTLGIGMAADEFGASFFGNSATPFGVLEIPQKLTPTSRQNLRESVYGVHQGTKQAHHLMILEQGAKWQAATMPLQDAQFLQTRQFQVLDVCRLFRMPPNKLGDYSQSHLANIEEANLDYVQTTLLGWVLAVECEWNLKFLTASERAKGLFIHFNMKSLMRGNTAARTSYYGALRNLGAMNADEIRVREGMNPIGPEKGGDLYLVQAQYQPLALAGQAKPTPPVPDPEAAPDPDAIAPPPVVTEPEIPAETPTDDDASDPNQSTDEI